MDCVKVLSCIDLTERTMNRKLPSFVYFVFFIFLMSGMGIAFLSHPRCRRLVYDLQEVGDDFVGVLERVLDRIQVLENSHKHSSVDLVDVVFAFIREFRNMYFEQKCHADSDGSVAPVNCAVSQAREDTRMPDDTLTEHIQWLQRRGRAIARRSASHF